MNGAKSTSSEIAATRLPVADRKRLVIVIVNYRTPQLVIDCLRSLRGELDAGRDSVVVVDNGSGDGSPEQIEGAMGREGHGHPIRIVRSPTNRGFAAANNIGIASAEADFYLLLNSDTIVRSGAVAELLSAAASCPRAGIIGPRLEHPSGAPTKSTFRYRTPLGELVESAATAVITRILKRYEVCLPVSSAPLNPDWISFACVLVRREMIDAIGPMDEGYFMYFEDIDYSRRARAAGWEVLHWPPARVVHLHGASSPTEESIRRRARPPAYYYVARSRYFAKFYGRRGLWLANLSWLAGRGISLVREWLGRGPAQVCEKAWRDIWTNALNPLESAREPAE